jgi:hypothetical protein
MYFLYTLHCDHLTFNFLFSWQFKTLSHEIGSEKDSIKIKKKLEDKIEKKMNKKEEGDDLIFIWTVKYHKKVYFIFLKKYSCNQTNKIILTINQ